MRLFGAGVAVLTVSFLLNVLGKVTTVPDWYGWCPRTLGLIGLLAFVGGLIGLVVGGRRGNDPEETLRAAVVLLTYLGHTAVPMD